MSRAPNGSFHKLVHALFDGHALFLAHQPRLAAPCTSQRSTADGYHSMQVVGHKHALALVQSPRLAAHCAAQHSSVQHSTVHGVLTWRRNMKGSRIWCRRWMTTTRFSWSISRASLPASPASDCSAPSARGIAVQGVLSNCRCSFQRQTRTGCSHNQRESVLGRLRLHTQQKGAGKPYRVLPGHSLTASCRCPQITLEPLLQFVARSPAWAGANTLVLHGSRP
jgi:hypothetical protein